MTLRTSYQCVCVCVWHNVPSFLLNLQARLCPTGVLIIKITYLADNISRVSAPASRMVLIHYLLYSFQKETLFRFVGTIGALFLTSQR